MTYDGTRKKGGFFGVNEAVSLVKWSDISEYSVSRGESGVLLARQRNYNKAAVSLALPSHTSIFHPSLFCLLCYLEGPPDASPHQRVFLTRGR